MIVAFPPSSPALRRFGLSLFGVLAGLAFGVDEGVASQSAGLRWTPSPSPNIGAYKVYYGTQSGNYSSSMLFPNTPSAVVPGLEDGTTYYFAVSAIDGNGNESDLSGEAAYTVPQAVPVRITQAQGTTGALGAVDVRWSPSPESDVYGYTVYYGTQSGAYTGTTTFYYASDGVISGLTAGARYYFAVSTIDVFGDEGVLSSEASSVVPTPTPIVLKAQTTTNVFGVELSWNVDANDGITGYNVYYGTTSGNYSGEQSYGAVNAVIVGGLQAGQTYYFAVNAVDGYGDESGYSKEVSAVVPVPTPLVLRAQGTTQAMRAVALSWNPSPNPDVYGYNVHYGLQSGVYTNTVEFDYVTNGIIPGLAGGTRYYFSVSAIDSYGDEGVLSREVSDTVPVPAPLVVRAKAQTSSPGVQLTWNIDPTEGITGYTVYYGAQSGNYDSSAYVGMVSNTVIGNLNPKQLYYFTVVANDDYGDQSDYSNEATAVTASAKPMLLQTQVVADDNGVPTMIRVFTPSVVNGNWEMDTSTDLQNWSYYSSGWGSGNGDGYDVSVNVPIDPTQPRVFFRVINY